LSGEADANDTYIEFTPPGGPRAAIGTHAVSHVCAMAERHKYKVEIIEETAGDEAASNRHLLVKGHNAHGWPKRIRVHRLVRISPFDSNARRHTSFASVWSIR